MNQTRTLALHRNALRAGLSMRSLGTLGSGTPRRRVTLMRRFDATNRCLAGPVKRSTATRLLGGSSYVLVTGAR
jgi:hypothetical protein